MSPSTFDRTGPRDDDNDLNLSLSLASPSPSFASCLISSQGDRELSRLWRDGEKARLVTFHFERDYGNVCFVEKEATYQSPPCRKEKRGEWISGPHA